MTIAAPGYLEAITMLLWKQRLRNPSLSVTVTKAEIDHIQQCLAVTKQKPKVIVELYRKPMPPAGKGAAQEYEEPDGTFIVRICDAKSGDAIIPMEQTQDGVAEANDMRRINILVGQADQIAGQLARDVATQTISDSNIRDGIECLRAMAKLLK